jgi:hypothetical protein
LAFPSPLNNVDPKLSFSGCSLDERRVVTDAETTVEIFHAAPETVGHQVRGKRVVDADSVEDRRRAALVLEDAASAVVVVGLRDGALRRKLGEEFPKN